MSMKITKTQLKQIIKEELLKLQEYGVRPISDPEEEEEEDSEFDEFGFYKGDYDDPDEPVRRDTSRRPKLYRG